MRAHRSSCAPFAALFLALIPLGQACSQGAPPAAAPSPAAAESTAVDRFEVTVLPMRRGAGHLLRLDTATGQTWIMGAMQAPKWQAMREGDAGVPTPDGSVPGRYRMTAIMGGRGSPTLVRIDGATGQIWRKGSTSDGPWVPVPNPDPSVTQPDPDWEPVPEPLINRLPIAPPPPAAAPGAKIPGVKAPGGKAPARAPAAKAP